MYAKHFSYCPCRVPDQTQNEISVNCSELIQGCKDSTVTKLDEMSFMMFRSWE